MWRKVAISSALFIISDHRVVLKTRGWSPPTEMCYIRSHQDTGSNNYQQLITQYVITTMLSSSSSSSSYRVIQNDCRGFNKLSFTIHVVLQMQPHVISFYGVTSRIRFMFLLFPQVSRNWRYESEPPLKPSPLTCYKQFGTNSIIVLMFVESRRVHI